jgi:hypothetical protein
VIALIEGQLYDMVPLVTTDTEFRIELGTDAHMKAYIGEKRIDYGVIWVSFNKSVDIHPKTGEIRINTPGFAKIRGIFGSFHHDFDLNITTDQSS